MKSPATEPRSTVIYTSIVAGSPKRALQVGGVAGCVGHAHCTPIGGRGADESATTF